MGKVDYTKRADFERKSIPTFIKRTDEKQGIVGCHGEVESFGDFELCTSKEGVVGIERWCESQSAAGIGTLVVGVLPDDYVGECAEYGLKIIATYGIGLPTF